MANGLGIGASEPGMMEAEALLCVSSRCELKMGESKACVIH